MSAEKFVAFDIETGPLPEETIRSIAPGFKEEDVKVGNLGLEKRIEKIAQAKQRHVEGIINKAALNAEYGKILAIGFMDHSGPEYLIGDEQDILPAFWSRVLEFVEDRRLLVGHNIMGFDLPFLFRRSLLSGCKVPPRVSPRGRYWPQEVWVDLMEIWKAGDYKATISLDRFCKATGLEGKNGSGEHFSEMFEQDREKAIEYLHNDVKITYELAKRVLACTEGAR